MNNFLRQFGSFKKNQNGINEYVDYLGAKYTQDPNTGMWKSNGRSLNEQMLFEEAMRSQGGYGGEEGSGGRSQASRANYELGFSSSQNQPYSSKLADPFGNLTTSGGASVTHANGRYSTNSHNRSVPIYLAVTASTAVDPWLSGTLLFRTVSPSQVRINLSINALTSAIYNMPSPPENNTYVFNYTGTWEQFGPTGSYSKQITIAIKNSQTDETIDSFTITDTIDYGLG